MPTSATASSGSAAASPQTPTRLAGPLARGRGGRDQLEHGGLPGVGEVSEVGGEPVGGHRVLREVVGADGQEVDDLEHPVGQQRGARHLDHDAGLEPAAADLLGEVARPRRPWRPSAPSPRSRCPSRAAAAAMPSSCRSSSPGLLQREPQPADAEGRVLLVLAAWRTRSACRSRRRGCVRRRTGPRPRRRRAPRRRSPPARRPTARRGGRGSTARCGTGRRPRPAPPARGRADSPSATLASSLTRTPSVVSAGPVHDSSAARAARSASTRAAASAASTRRVDGRRRSRRPAREPPAGSPSAPATPTTHGMPSWRAMIAVWLVAPPFSVTSASTSAGSRPAVSAGRQVARRRAPTATSGSTTPGSGSPTSRATRRRSMSSRSVARSAISPPIAVKMSTNCATPSCTAVEQRRRRPRPGSATAWRSPLSRVSPALAVSTSVAAPLARAALAENPSATASAAASYAARADSASAVAGVRLDRRPATPPARPAPRARRRARERRGCRAARRRYLRGAEEVTMATSKTTGSLTVNTFGTKTTYSQIARPPVESGARHVRRGAAPGHRRAGGQPRPRRGDRARDPLRRHHGDGPPRPVAAGEAQAAAPGARRRGLDALGDDARGAAPRPRPGPGRREGADRPRRRRAAARGRLHAAARRRQHHRPARRPAARRTSTGR